MNCMKNMQHLFTSSEIPLLILVVLAGPLLASSPGPHLKETYFDHLPLDDILFTDHVLMEVSARSQIECSKKCAETQGCAMWTFHSSPQGPPGHCRLHSQLQTATDGKQSMPGARSMARRRRCDGGYVPACDRCLKAVERRVKYTTARQDCTDMQGHLAMAKSSGELGCLQSFMKNNSFPTIWLGADDVKESRVFRWADGTLLRDDSPLWVSGDPNHVAPGRDCVVCRDSGGFADTLDHNNHHYICVKDDM